MKFTIVGGGGVRTPRLMSSLVARQSKLGLQELWLHDTDTRKLAIIGNLCQQMASGAEFRVYLTDDLTAALEGSNAVITTIRPGGEQGRVLDETIALRAGVLGQETTGAGGFAMAMRSIPSILRVVEVLDRVGTPGAWIFNFTNPAGLVTQALHDAGFGRVVGICDSANTVLHAVSGFLNVPASRLHHTVYGLNHLSWTSSVTLDGTEVLQNLLDDPAFIAATHLAMFHPALIQWQRCFLNEYLHYYYHRDEALSALRNKAQTRGQQVAAMTATLMEALISCEPARRPDVYRTLMSQRDQTYMAHARDGAERHTESETEEEGYAGVALSCLQAMITGSPAVTGLNVRNQGAIAGLAADDVVEVTCEVSADGIRPLPVESVPDFQMALIQDVKLYERLASRAILSRNRQTAVHALTVHPLVGSFPLAERLVSDYLLAHRSLVEGWN